MITKHVLPRFGLRRLDAVTRRDVADLVEDLRAKGLAPGTIRLIMAVVGLIFTRAVQADLIMKHPARDLDEERRDLMRGTVRPARSLTAEELAKLLDEAKRSLRFDRYAYLLTLARTGLRRGEAAGLKVGDVDLDARTATIVRTVRRDRVGGTQSGKPRTVHLTTEVVDALRELLRQRRVVTINPTARADEWLFADKRGNHINIDNFKGAHVARLCGRVGLDGLRLHDLRHTWASIRLHERAKLREVQEQLGHATPGFTLAVYGHLQPGDRKESMDRFSAALARTRKD